MLQPLFVVAARGSRCGSARAATFAPIQRTDRDHLGEIEHGTSNSRWNTRSRLKTLPPVLHGELLVPLLEALQHANDFLQAGFVAEDADVLIPSPGPFPAVACRARRRWRGDP